MQGQIVFFTGATSGIGKHTACHLANKGARVVIPYRSESKKNELITYFDNNYPSAIGSMDFISCDLNSFESIENACQEFHSKYKELDILFHNAGIMNFSYKESANNIEQTLHVNLLAPMLLTHYLIDKLSASKRPKLIYTSSALHQGNIQFDNMEFKDSFSSFKSYRQSKLGLILMTRYLANQYKGSNLGVYAVHPGIVKTQLGRDANVWNRMIFKLMGTTPEKGAKTLIYVAEKHQDELESGAYYASQKITKTTPESYDLEKAEQLSYKIRDYLFDFLNKSSLMYKL